MIAPARLRTALRFTRASSHDRQRARDVARLCVLLAATAGSPCFADQDVPVLGRLFYTPEERLALEKRASAYRGDPGDTVSLTGVLRRADGKTTVWVNGAPTEADHPAAALKVGATLDRLSGEVRDVLRGGSIAVHPAR